MPRKIDELFYDIGFEVDEGGMKRAQARTREFNDAVTQGQEGLERFGATGAAALRQVGERAGLTSGQMAQVTERVGELVDSLKRDLARGIASARQEFDKGIIDEDEFRDTVRASVEAFEGELSRLERRLERTGQLPPDAKRRIVREFQGTGDDAVDAFIAEFAKDADRAEEVLRKTGREGGRKFGREVEKESKSGLSNVEKFLRGGFIAGVVTALGFAAQRIVRFFADVARKITETLRKAGEIEGVERAFDTLSTAAGLNAVQLLAELRRGARSTASDLDLMRSAAEALQTGLRGTEEQFGDLVNIGRRLAKTIGTDANEAFERLVRGVVRGRRRILDDIGILVNFRQAHADFAAQLGVSVEALDEQQKAQARLNAVVERGNEIIAQLGPDILTTGEKVDQVATFLRNVTNETIAAVATTPRVAEWLDTFADGSEDAAENMRNLEVQIGATVDVIVESFSTFEGFIRLLNEFARAATGRGFGPGFAEQFGQAIARRAQQQTLRDIRGISNLEKLEGRRLEVLERMNDLQQKRVEGAIKEAEFSNGILNLHEQLLTITQQRRRLAVRPGGEEGGLSEEKIQQRIDAAKELIETLQTLAAVGLGTQQFEQLTEEQQKLVRSNIELRSEIAKLEDVMATGRGTDAMARRLEFLRGKLRDNREEIAETITGFDDLDEALGKIAEGFTAFRDRPDQPLIALETEEQKLRKLRAALERIAAAEGSAAEKSLEVQRAVEASGVSFGDLSQAIQLTILRIIGYQNAVRVGLTEPTEESEEQVDDLAAAFEGLERSARGILALADAMGALDDETRQTLQGVVELASAVQSIATSGFSPGAAIQGIGGIFGIISGLVAEDPEAAQFREAMRENTQAIRELTRRVDKIGQVFAQVPADIIAEVGEAIAAFQAQQAAGFPGGPAPEVLPARFRKEMEALGLTATDVAEIIEAAGGSVENFGHLMTVLEEGVLVGEDAVERANAQLEDFFLLFEEVNLDRVLNTLEGQLTTLQQRFDLFDISDPIEQLRRMRETLLEFADLPPEIEAAIQGADLGTPEGRAQFEQALQRIFELLLSQENLGILGGTGMTREEFIDLILQLESLEDTISEEETAGGAGGFQVTRGITEITGNRVVGVLTTLSFQADERNLLLREILEEMGGTVPEFLAPIARIDGPPPVLAGQGDITITFDDIVVSVDAEGPLDSGNARSVGEQIGQGFISKVDRELGRLERNRRRLQGEV